MTLDGIKTASRFGVEESLFKLSGKVLNIVVFADEFLLEGIVLDFELGDFFLKGFVFLLQIEEFPFQVYHKVFLFSDELGVVDVTFGVSRMHELEIEDPPHETLEIMFQQDQSFFKILSIVPSEVNAISGFELVDELQHNTLHIL